MALLVLAPAALYYLLLNSGKSAGYFEFWTVGFASMLVTSKFYVQWLAMINSLVGMTLLVIALLGVVIAPAQVSAHSHWFMDWLRTFWRRLAVSIYHP